jgi:hypothetical protein
MTENKTEPTLVINIIVCLKEWNKGSDIFTDGTLQGGRAIKEAIIGQAEIGWYNFLNGRLSKWMISTQSQHLSDIGSKKSH